MVAKSDRDQVTKLMGDYLLKGYTLLDDYCETCKSPMMRKRGEEFFCVHCRDVIKVESKNEMEVETCNLNNTTVPSNKRFAVKAGGDSIPKTRADLSEAIESVIVTSTRKLAWSSALLAESNDISQCLQLNQLIQSTMETLEKAHKFCNV